MTNKTDVIAKHANKKNMHQWQSEAHNTQHRTKNGEPKLVESCSFPITGEGVVDRVYSDLAVIDVTPHGFQLVELAPGIDFKFVQDRTGAELLPAAE